MTRRVLAAAALLACLAAGGARGGRHPVALFAPEAHGVAAPREIADLLPQAISEGLADRFDVRLAGAATGRDVAEARRRARDLGAA